MTTIVTNTGSFIAIVSPYLAASSPVVVEYNDSVSEANSLCNSAHRHRTSSDTQLGQFRSSAPRLPEVTTPLIASAIAIKSRVLDVIHTAAMFGAAQPACLKRLYAPQ